ncbi:MAG: hypothetical protein KF734_19325 [Saprospiraceae bacterium]|nr:hypothetical protein [Saprospiraceae bacterium]
MKQHEAVIQTLENLGGVATLGKLNQEVMKIEDCKWGTKTPFASIRRIVQLNKDIYKIKPGLYGLVRHRNRLEQEGYIVETEKNRNAKEVVEFNHSYYQGIILSIGNIKGLQTFVPNQDKNRKFLSQPLGDLATLKSIPPFSFENLVKRSSSVDVIWFNERRMPHSFFEVEHSTTLQNSLAKFVDLQDFNSRMIIVANVARRKEFSHKIGFAAFREVASRVKFVNYEELLSQYETAIRQQLYETIL